MATSQLGQPKQLSLHLGRCEFVYRNETLEALGMPSSWRCTKWLGHTKKRGNKAHTALAPSGWHPDFAVTLTGEPNDPP